MKTDLSIIIVNWNTRELLSGCLESVFDNVQGLQFEVIVFDNASTDGSQTMVFEDFPGVKLFKSEENLGFAAGNNRALQSASGNFVLLLNPDTLLVGNAVQELYAALQNNPAIGVVGAQLLNPDGTLQMSYGHFPSLRTEIPLLNRLGKTDDYEFSSDSVVPVDWVSGAALMTRRSLFDEVGVLDEDYWLYTEETDWCFRVRKSGWEVVLIPTARVTHIARAASRQAYKKTMLHFYRSRLLFMAKHCGLVVNFIAKTSLVLKVCFWLVIPTCSPLAKAYSDLTKPDIRFAYVRLIADLLMLKKGDHYAR
jgi:GT2 family glycosyltransferase